MAALRSKRMPLKNLSMPLYLNFRPKRYTWRIAEGGVFLSSPSFIPMAKRDEAWSSHDLLRLRDAVLQVETPEAALAFLNSCGEFDGRAQITAQQFRLWVEYFRSLALSHDLKAPECLKIYDLRELTELRDHSRWAIEKDPRSSVGWSVSSFHSLAAAAIDQLIRIERIDGGFLRCKNCNLFFAKEDTKRQDFCSQRCGHRFTQRERRRVQRQNLKAAEVAA